MPRRMSCALTISAVRDRTKTVTRRSASTWTNLHPGDRLTLVEKGMGLPKGSQQVVLAEVEIVSVRVENIGLVQEPGELAAEGFPNMSVSDFIVMWCNSHRAPYSATGGVFPCRRIEWRYLNGVSK